MRISTGRQMVRILRVFARHNQGWILASNSVTVQQ